MVAALVRAWLADHRLTAAATRREKATLTIGTKKSEAEQGEERHAEAEQGGSVVEADVGEQRGENQQSGADRGPAAGATRAVVLEMTDAERLDR